MGRFTNVFLSLVQALCGSTTIQEEPPTSEYQKSDVAPPPLPPKPPRITPERRPEQPIFWPPHAPISQPHPGRRVATVPEKESKPAYQHRPGPRVTPVRESELSQPRPSRRVTEQESKPIYPPRPGPRVTSPGTEFELKPISRPLPGPRVTSPVLEQPTFQPRVTSPVPEHDLPPKDDDHYLVLRAKATEQGHLMARCFQESHEAYSRRDGAAAKEFSEKGKQHKQAMENLNAEASAWIFKQNNLDSKPGEIDLHGLYVKEAVSYADKGIQLARQKGYAEARLIVGKGLHSDGHVAKIKPAIVELMETHNVPTEVDPSNAGVLIARLH